MDMADQSELVTVFRSADETAEEDARGQLSLLKAQGIAAVLLDDQVPGIPQGAWEVRVSPSDLSAAEEIVRAQPEAAAVGTESAELDMETVFSRPAGGITQEMEATAVSSLLQNAGINTIVIGDAVLPNLGFEVRVPKEDSARARDLIAEAIAAGPAAADEAERLSEGS